MPRMKKGTEPADPSKGVQSVLLALSLLETLARSDEPKRVTDLAVELGQTKARISRYIRTLVKHGYAIHDAETGRYRSGPQLVLMGQNVVDNMNLVNESRPITRRLRDRLGHAVSIAQMIGENLHVVDVIQGKSPFSVTTIRGTRLSFHASALGKIALAYGPPVLAEHVLKEELPAITPHTITDSVKLEWELKRIESRGWAISPNQLNVGINGLAAPIFDARGLFAGAIAILDLIHLLPEKPTNIQVQAITEAASEISSKLGFNDYPQQKSMQRRKSSRRSTPRRANS